MGARMVSVVSEYACDWCEFVERRDENKRNASLPDWGWLSWRLEGDDEEGAESVELLLCGMCVMRWKRALSEAMSAGTRGAGSRVP